jgi:type I restriction enzyme R subunit
MQERPEESSRRKIDELLKGAGWVLQDTDEANVTAGRGVAIREFPLKRGHGFADYLLYVDGRAAGVVEAKKEGTTLTSVEIQTEKYNEGLAVSLPAHRRPLPFCYQSTGVETRFTNLLEPDARSRGVFCFHRPETLADWLSAEAASPGSMLRARLREMAPLATRGLRSIQTKAIVALEQSLKEGRPRALVQMASGAGKTFTACNFTYRLIKHANARRVLFLVDRKHLGRQALKEFQQFDTPDDGRKFTELYNVQLMTSNQLDRVCRVCITTIQRLFSMLKGEPDFEGDEEASHFLAAQLFREPVPVSYNPMLPVETFDVIITDECHRSIYNLWRQVLEYFDAFLIGLTATPSKQTLGFFNQNLVCEYNYEQAVADGVNVDHDVYVIQTKITGQGSTVEAGQFVDKRERQSRRVRWEQLEEDFSYAADQLDRDVVAKDQIRTVIRTFKEKLFTEIFPGRTEVPKTLIFAKDDSHAEDIVEVVREEFGKGNDFCQKITYRTGMVRVVTKQVAPDGTETEETSYQSGGVSAEQRLSEFRNSYNPRIVVTVDMIATGTDVRPLEIVFFMREVKSRNLFEQMKGRGARVIEANELRGVTSDAAAKTRFVMVDAVGLSHQELSDTHPLERKPSVKFEALLDAVAFGNREKDVLSSLAARLVRLDRQLTMDDRRQLEAVAGGRPLAAIAGAIIQALDPDVQIEAAVKATGSQNPSHEDVARAAEALFNEAAKPLATNPAFRNRLIAVKKSYEQTIDTISKDEVLEAAFSEEAREKARRLVESFEEFIRANRDEITALEVLYSRPYRRRLTAEQVTELAEALERPPRGWTPTQLWRAYETLERSKVRGSGMRVWTDVVSLVRFALAQDPELRPFEDHVRERFSRWLASQESSGRKFTAEELAWLEAIRDHVAASIDIRPDDLRLTPFVERGGLGKAYQLFGKELDPILNELNEALAA